MFYALLVANLVAFTLPHEIEERTLANGLKVVVWPDHDIPNVALYTWYRVGGRNEYPGITGLAHYFEHMMFNGTSNLSPGEFDRIMEAAGGRNNAYTSSDVTVYQDWFPSTALQRVLKLEADRMENLDFDPDVVESERGVVYSERRTSVDNNAFRALNEQVQATAFVAHPYQFPVIGWPSDIEGWTKDDLQTFYRTHYAPNNATMIIVGDVDATRVFALVEETFGSIPRQPAPSAVTTTEPEQQGERRLTLERPAQNPIVQWAYHIDEATSDDTPALSLLMTVLVQGDSSRLHQKLVEEKQLAIQFGGWIDEGFDPGLAWFYAILPRDVAPSELEAALDAELNAVRENGLTQAELNKAKNVQLADLYRALETINGKAEKLGTYQVLFGDWKRLFGVSAQYERVALTDLQRVASKYLLPKRRTVGVLQPLRGDTP